MHFPRAAAGAATALNVLTITVTPNGFTSPPRGWNSYALQANHPAAPNFVFNQAGVMQQCDAMASKLGTSNGYTYCSLDSGWSVGGNGDEYGRIIFDTSVFNLTTLSQHLHDQGQKLGVYVVPGAFLADVNKTILGTDVTIGEVCSGNNGLARCNFDFSQPAVQTWHDSVVDLFAEW
jgi:alpha-galactosidase